MTRCTGPQTVLDTHSRIAAASAPEGGEAPEYLARQLITCIGNKRAILGPIADAIRRVKERLGRDALCAADLFSGSGVVSRFLKQHASRLVSNDIEDYAATIARGYLRNRETVDWPLLREIVRDLNRRVDSERMPAGFIEEMYAPRDEARITAEDRVFYTRENARRLDAYRRLIDEAPAAYRDLLLGPLLARASIHANTAGVFKGFYKDRTTKIGRFGGTGADALARITGRIELDVPVLSRFSCEVEVLQQDANEAAKRLENLDLAYIDPPYNQHPYGSNYFMLNLLVNYRRPEKVSRVSGIPADWRRSGYNVRARAESLFGDLLASVDARFLLVSFSNEGFIPPARMRSMLAELGPVEIMEIPYNAFRGSRNLRSRPVHVTEQLFLVERR